MTFLESMPRPSTRLNRGNLILANAAQIDTGRVRARLDAFLEIHRQYLEAQVAVNEAEALVAHERSVVDRLDGDANNALVRLSAAMQLDGEPLRNPFARFAPLGPGKMRLLSWQRKVTAIRALAANLRRSLGVSPAVLAAAAAAEQAAERLETALAGWTLRRTYLGLTRQTRDTLGLQWDDAHRALNLLSRSIIEEPLLHTVLFARPSRPTRRAKQSAAAEPPEVEAPEEESRTAAALAVLGPSADPAEDPLQAVRRLIEPFAAVESSPPIAGAAPDLESYADLPFQSRVHPPAALHAKRLEGGRREAPSVIGRDGLMGVPPDPPTRRRADSPTGFSSCVSPPPPTQK